MKTFITFLLFTFCVQAQEHNIWYFGFHAGLDFNGGAPVALTDGQINTTEGCASIADDSGNLLFYTDGVTVYSKNHQVMQNGLGLTGHTSSTQSAIILNKPGSTGTYYIFTTTAGGYSDGLRYSTVDMDAASGMGVVIEKNILLHTPTTEALTAAWHSNGQDIWVVAHNYGSDLFSAYLITSGGVNVNPITSASGGVPTGNGHCAMRVSPNGHKLAFTIAEAIDGTRLFDFNAATGAVSNPVQLPTDGIYGLEFSPSGNVLYVCNSWVLHQYDLLADDIGASAIEVFALPIFEIAGNMGTLQRAPDNKIYVARSGRNYLSVINDPDIVGLNCGFQEDAITLGAGFENYNNLGLPNNVLSPVFKINASPNITCLGAEITFSITANINQLGDIHWDFGDGGTSTAYSPSHIFQAAGSYTVTLTSQSQGIARVSESTIIVSPLPAILQPDDLELCDQENQETALFDLGAQTASIIGTQNSENFIITYHTFLEHAELGMESLDANFTNTINPQVIYVRIQDKFSGCYATTSFNVIVSPKPIIAMPDSYGLCQGNSTTLTAPEGFETYLWSTGEITRIISINEPGNYTVTVTKDYNGRLCENSKTITVYVSDAPTITQVRSGDWTDNYNTINISVSGLSSYEYSLDGLTYQDSPEFTGLESGIFNVYARDKNGCGVDTQEVTLLMYPKFFTPNGDGINDTWQIKYSWNEPGLSVHILDRYGKYITSLQGNRSGWDGKLDGHTLPATDYWFIVERKDGRQHKGHFSMIR